MIQESKELTDEATSPDASRLSLLYLMSVTAGVAIAIALVSGIEHLRFPADMVFLGREGVRKIDAGGAIVATLYGVCATTFVFAWKSGNVWSSPGKIISLLLGTMCLLDLGINLFAALVVYYRMQTEVPAGMMPDTRGIVFGFWYRNISPPIGYVAGLPILALVIIKTGALRVHWRMVMIGFFIATALVAAQIHFDFTRYMPRSTRHWWYFEIMIGIPVVLIALALLIDLMRQQRVDWWTAVTGPLVVSAWGLLIAIKFLG